MAYHIYQTEAFVLDDLPSGEANKVFFLLTPDLGRIVARAQGIRLLKSKLRFHLDKYAQVRVSLVRGKENWRLVGAEAAEGILSLEIPAKRELIAKIFSLLARFIQGEGEQAELYKDLRKSFIFLDTIEDSEELEGWELLMALRIFSRLGYIKNTAEFEPGLSFTVWNRDLMPFALAKRTQIIAAINGAVAASHI